MNQIAIDDTVTDNDDKDEAVPLAEQLMKRGEFLRQLREMELADQAEREQTQEETEQPSQGKDDVIHVLSNGKKVLCYESFLKHQRYYDDLKHVDCHFIDFGISSCGGRLVMEQDKCLGKGGLCWDAAFILADHLIEHEQEWNHNHNNNTRTSLVELGSGTGLCGCMIAKAVADCHVRITDLPELLPLMTRNVRRNFDSSHIDNDYTDSFNDSLASHASMKDKELLYELLVSTECDTIANTNTMDYARGRISANVLKWGHDRDYQQEYDVVLGADVVASLYDPIALADTMHALCHEKSVVYISFKARLAGPHEQFEKRLESLFTTVERIRPATRNKNPQVWILKATGKSISAA
jgi:predicted nicotinamide N-methyase